ncbi:hypothetical protein [Acidovorax sp. K2F]|uniref:hypothetical protein n=1 Tax=Acidovorax sp. K2F TaxID=2978125 RepID=UPI0021B0DDF4|nr:hypothetical protein [Acidovorax sp. K2F]MCT6721618.1 hypothetical protein [Acidovorax sp. K2F]
MTKYQVAIILLIFAVVQLVMAAKIARLSKRKYSENSAQLDVEIDRVNAISKRIQVVAFSALLVWLGIQYFA